MSQVDFSKLLASPLFTGLARQEIEYLSSIFTSTQVSKGMTVFIENMPGESLYIINQGAVQISQMLAEVAEQTLIALGPGEVFGEMAVIDGGSRLATARIIEDTILYSLNRKSFNILASEKPRLGLQLTLNIVRIFSVKLRTAKKDYRTMLNDSLSHKS